MRVLSLLMLSLLLAGCHGEGFFLDPNPSFNPPHLQMQVMVRDQWAQPTDSVSPTLILDGQWYPGTDRYGEPRTGPTPQVEVAGEVVQAVSEGSEWHHHSISYRRDVPWSSLAAQPLRVVVPTETGSSDTLQIGLWARAGGASQFVVAGSGAKLELIAPPSGPSSAAQGGQWQLVVTGSGGGSVQQGGAGAPPTLLEVPAANLSEQGAPYTATLTMNHVYTSPHGPPRGRANAYVHVQETLRWRIGVLTSR